MTCEGTIFQDKFHMRLVNDFAFISAHPVVVAGHLLFDRILFLILISRLSICHARDLSFIEIYGDIPFSVSKLKQLKTLILNNNQLIGPISSTLSQIPNLKILNLAQNKLGEIPRLMYWNEVLQYL